ncbi:glutamate synthase large subunit [Candidatus Woesearchaeota archaeon]|nr:glutamate synthase large subunit [Candidatus Woesearchaeota archaeon]
MTPPRDYTKESERDVKGNGLPKGQGMYSPQFERDACGIGFLVNIKGNRSHEIVRKALQMLVNLSHRGGCGCEKNLGDGAGILVQIPHHFFRTVCKKDNINLPESGAYGVGMVFLPRDDDARKHCKEQIDTTIREEGQAVLGWRDVPIDASSLCTTATTSMPHICQVFVGKNSTIHDELSFERKLYIIRKRIEKMATEMPDNRADALYFPSLSSRTLVYKGMLNAEQVDAFYTDLNDPSFDSAIAVIHSRYSTNTFPSWKRAHPYRYIIHNGEINTLRGNINAMHARQSVLQAKVFGEDMHKIFPVIHPDGSDSAMFDNCLEFLTLSGYSLPHAVMMMIPEPWEHHESMSDEKKAFYEYHSCIMEPWDGPAAIGFTDGRFVGAVLDRNGLRPFRYYVTKDGMVVAASEVGVLPLEVENITMKGRLHPGRMLLVDTVKGKIISDEELKHNIASEHPYRTWLDKHMVKLSALPQPQSSDLPVHDPSTLLLREKAFGYTYEDLRAVLVPMVQHGLEAVGAMGTDIPLAALSDKPQLLYNYFKQLFAQVTNPPIDAIREGIVTSSMTYLGSQGNILALHPENCHQIKLESPILTNGDFAKLKSLTLPGSTNGLKSATLPILFNPENGGQGLLDALDALFEDADAAMGDGANILILSDRGVDAKHAPIPALLAVSGLHHHLIREEKRTQVALVLESGEPREVHHFSLLLGYGASAINPYLAFEAIEGMVRDGMLVNIDYAHAAKNYVKAVVKGVVKVISKMGISTIQGYQGAQIFEAVGINNDVIDRYFTWTASRIQGIGMGEIAAEAAMRHESAFGASATHEHDTLDSGGFYQWRSDGEYHLFNPETIYKLQAAVRSGNYAAFKEYSKLLDRENKTLCTLRSLLEFTSENSIPLDEVESVESICKRFKTGAMSYGSISQEAHEALAIAMNRIGGKSNTGEGGENPARFVPLANGDSKCSAIKQVASGRFGVTSEYLVNAKELQIKMAQGAKPGEGGQLPARKVYPWIAKVRYSTPGVELISPPPHHDIYSIEDLAELIHDLKNANKYARISVKLVAEAGVGTIAAGVAKGRADVVLISGHDGGTGASPRTSIRHAGLPWELGLAEAHQTLLLNNLRSRIVIETDGKLMTGRDVVIAALLGAEEFGFATAPLVSLGCVMMRICNLDTCPVGIATQNPELRKKFGGDPQHVVNFMTFIAQEVREYMARLGFRTINEMVGRTDKLKMVQGEEHWKAKGIDLSPLLYRPDVPESVGRFCQEKQNHGLEHAMDNKLLELCKAALDHGHCVDYVLPIANTNRVVGTMLGSELTRRYGSKGLAEDTISLRFSGSAGQSFGAFIPRGMTLWLCGDGNDYIGKGLSGGKIIVYPPTHATFAPEENIIIGNVAFYGATSGEAYVRGMAGERFCVRNSGVRAVVEAVGDHGCEYMTGGRVVVLGKTGRNFAAGMSGGVAYVLDAEGDFATRCNREMVDLEPLSDQADIREVKQMIEQHILYTESTLAKGILNSWEKTASTFVKVMPRDYKKMISAIQEAQAQGLSKDEASMAAFTAVNAVTS